jgi:hypothetical protein
VIKLITEFVSQKFTFGINCLKTITENLENGHIEAIDKLKDIENQSIDIIKKVEPCSSKENKPNIESYRAKVKICERKPLHKEEMKPFDRVAAHKKARKVMDSLKDVMDLSRQDFL